MREGVTAREGHGDHGAGVTEQRGVWAEILDGAGGLTCRSERLSARQRHLSARMSWKALKGGVNPVEPYSEAHSDSRMKDGAVIGFKETRLRKRDQEELLPVWRQGSGGWCRAWSGGRARRVGRKRETT